MDQSLHKLCVNHNMWHCTCALPGHSATLAEHLTLGALPYFLRPVFYDNVNVLAEFYSPSTRLGGLHIGGVIGRRVVRQC